MVTRKCSSQTLASRADMLSRTLGKKKIEEFFAQIGQTEPRFKKVYKEDKKKPRNPMKSSLQLRRWKRTNGKEQVEGCKNFKGQEQVESRRSKMDACYVLISKKCLETVESVGNVQL